MTDENPRSPFGWSKRYAAAQARQAQSKTDAVRNSERRNHIRKTNLAADLAAGRVTQDEHDYAVLEMDERLEAVRAEGEGPKVQAPSDAPAQTEPGAETATVPPDADAARAEVVTQAKARQRKATKAKAGQPAEPDSAGDEPIME